jgi:ubiquinone/menaquinone biosynthesis C-methylase UbiE
MSETAVQTSHALLPRATQDELARQSFVRDLKRIIATQLTPGVREVYENRVLPRFHEVHGRDPQDRHELRAEMMNDGYVQMWSAVRRISQELLWNAVGDSVERQLDELVDATHRPADAGGSVTLTPDLAVPSYLTAVDIHCMPTGYYKEIRDGDDVFAGALYDRGVYVYTMGQLGALNDDKGRAIIEHYLDQEHPDFAPRRILDMGCAVGHSTIPYVEAYPDAEVHALDIGAPMVRYAHARAEALGRKVHFSQQNAEDTTFEDASFDLIVSHILMHETSADGLRAIFAESFRLLAPGGIMIHAELPQYHGIDVFTQFMLDWDTYNNNEPFWGAMRDTDLAGLAVAVGFAPENVTLAEVPAGRKLQTGEKQQKGGTLGLVVGRKS